jgi:hypothetical protein
MIVYKPGKETSGEVNHAGTLTLDSQPLEPQANEFLFFKPLSLWYATMAALPNLFYIVFT